MLSSFFIYLLIYSPIHLMEYFTRSIALKDTYSTSVRGEHLGDTKHLSCLISNQGKPSEIYHITWTRDGETLSNNSGMELMLKVIICPLRWSQRRNIILLTFIRNILCILIYCALFCYDCICFMDSFHNFTHMHQG